MSLSYGLLGLLNYTPMAGYDLKKIFDDSINFFWSAQTSQIYRELNSLEARDLVVSEIKPGEKGPDRRIYHITDKGVSALKEWLSDVPESLGEDDRNAFLMRVFFSANVGIDELIFQMEKRLRKYKKDLQKLKSVETRVGEYAKMLKKESDVLFWEITIKRGHHDVKSHIKWAEESLDYLREAREKNKKK